MIHPAVWPQNTWAENWGLCTFFWVGELGPHLIQCHALGQRPTSLPSGVAIQPAIWPQQSNRYGPKIGGCVPLGEGELGFHLTVWPGTRPICVPSLILIHPTVWPQYTNVTDRQDRAGQDRQQSDSIGRTVLQTDAQKANLNSKPTVNCKSCS